MNASTETIGSDSEKDRRPAQPIAVMSSNTRTAVASLDPFADVAATQRYVPRQATERAITEMRAAIEAAMPAVISGPPGIGKTVVLRQLGLRLRPEFRTIYLPYPRLGPDELCAWLLASLGASPRDAPPWLFDAYRAHCSDQGERVLILLDDIASIPTDTAAWLEGQLDVEDGFLRLAAAACTPTPATRLFPSARPVEVSLTAPMSRSECDAYLLARLSGPSVRADARHWTEPVASTLHRISGGVPRALNSAASLYRWGCSLEAVERLVKGEPVEKERIDGTGRRDRSRQERRSVPSVKARVRRRLRLR